MGLKPEAFDYEGGFPARSRRHKEIGANVEVWPSSRKFESFESPVAAGSSPPTEEAPSDTRLFTDAANWIRRRGHGITYFALFVFTVILYLRPYELVPALSSLTSMAFYSGLITLIIYAIAQLAIEGNFTARVREVNLVLLLGVAALLSMPMAINPSEAWETFSELLIKEILIFIVIVNVVRTKRRLYWLLLLALGVSVYLSINAIQDYQLGIFKVGREETNNLRIAGAIRGLFENSNDLALHLVTMAPIAVALALINRGMLRKFVYIGAALLMVAAIVVTFSRGGFIALAAVSFFLVRKLGREQRGMSTAGFVLGALLFFAVAPGDYAGRLSTIFDSASDITGSATQRNQVLKRSILVTLRYPLFGVGIGNFHHKSYQELGTHNAYTQVGSEMGIPAMIVYIMFLAYPFKRLSEIEKKTYKKKDERFYYYLAIGLKGSLVAYMVASFFAGVAYQWYIYYLVGYAIAARRIYVSHAQTELSGAADQALPARPAELRTAG